VNPPTVIAHRGASHAHPPGNTVEAFAAAHTMGADWVELDVRFTADGGLAVHHDAHLPDGRVLVEVASVDLPSFVPLLDEALAACVGMRVNVEIKNAPGEPDWDEQRGLADAVVSALAGVEVDRLLVTSFDPAAIARVRALEPRLDTGLLVFHVDGARQVVDQAVAGGHRALNPWDPLVTADLVTAAHDAGLVVNVWTVDDPSRWAELIAFGVDGIITNVPDLLRAALSG
jgi:glycerophosphoryl diester phosphodiesterase